MDGSFGYTGRITRLFEEFCAAEDFRPFEIYSLRTARHAVPRGKVGALK